MYRISSSPLVNIIDFGPLVLSLVVVALLTIVALSKYKDSARNKKLILGSLIASVLAVAIILASHFFVLSIG